jgi:hypothetical protein
MKPHRAKEGKGLTSRQDGTAAVGLVDGGSRHYLALDGRRVVSCDAQRCLIMPGFLYWPRTEDLIERTKDLIENKKAVQQSSTRTPLPFLLYDCSAAARIL